MRIHLINPAFTASLWDFAGCSDLTGKRYAHPPLSLPTLAALTPTGHEVRLTDENVESVDLDWTADIVGLTGYHIQKDRVFELADAFRARGCRVVLGGPLVEESTIPECSLHADALFLGEAEYTWPRFLADCERGCVEHLYAQRELVDMRDSPAPRFDLLKLEAYTTTTIETSRGCPYQCEFCEIPARLGRRSRHKTTAQVMAEVRALHELGARSIFFIDDHFVGDRAFTVDLLQQLAEFVEATDDGLYFTCQFTINLAKDKELLDLFQRARFRRVFIGIETPRKASLLEARKRQNLAGELLDNIREVQTRGITIWAGIIVGFDTDDLGIFEEQSEFLQAAGIPVAMIGLLQAIPGTPLHERMQKSSRLRVLPTSGVRGTHESHLATNIRPISMSDAELVGGYQRLVKGFYDCAPFADRLLVSLRRAPRESTGRRRWPSLSEAGILARTLWYYLLGARPNRQMFLRVLRVTLKEQLDLETALMHLVVHKHLQAFYVALAAMPVPVFPDAVSGPGELAENPRRAG
jgi:radical SAM superfamily enzyme YgiQ (UPF0313 family)